MGIPEFLDSGRKSWTLDSGRWTLDADFKDGPDIMLSVGMFLRDETIL